MISATTDSEWHFASLDSTRFSRVAPRFGIELVITIYLRRDPDELIVRETNVVNMRLYWKSMAEMYVPLSLLESTLGTERQIFEAVSLDDMRNLMRQYSLSQF